MVRSWLVEPISTQVSIDGGAYGLSSERIQVVEVGERGPVAQREESQRFEQVLALPARTAVAYELTCAP